MINKLNLKNSRTREFFILKDEVFKLKAKLKEITIEMEREIDNRRAKIRKLKKYLLRNTTAYKELDTIITKKEQQDDRNIYKVESHINNMNENEVIL